jgi:hypothetical protein
MITCLTYKSRALKTCTVQNAQVRDPASWVKKNRRRPDLGPFSRPVLTFAHAGCTYCGLTKHARTHTHTHAHKCAFVDKHNTNYLWHLDVMAAAGLRFVPLTFRIRPGSSDSFSRPLPGAQKRGERRPLLSSLLPSTRAKTRKSKPST